VLADLGTPIPTQTIAAALAWPPERVRDAAAQLRHELQRLGQTVTLSPGDQLGLASFASCISDEQRAAVHREALTIDDATAHVLLAVLRDRRDDRSWTKLDDNKRMIGMQLVAAGRSPRTTACSPQATNSHAPSSRVSCLHSTGDTQSPDR